MVDADPSDDKLDVIRALIAKAESTEYPAEAEAFMSKAQTLMQIYAISEARIRGADTGSIAEERLPMAGSYSKERSLVWSVVALANRCQLITWSHYRSNAVTEMSLVGRASDRDMVKVLATSLELQAVRRMHELETDRGSESPVVQRRSFLRGFALQVQARLQAAKAEHQVHGAAAAALELASHAVDDYVDEHFDLANRRSQGRVDVRAYTNGRRAGASADLGANRVGSRRRALRP